MVATLSNRRVGPKVILANLEEIISGTGLVVTITVTVFNVTVRYLTRMSFNWAEETAAIGFAWVVFVGAAACYKRKMHIGIDVLVNVMSTGMRRTIEIAVDVFLLTLNIYLTYLSLIFSISAWAKPTAVLRISYTFVNMSATVGFGFMTIHAVRQLVRTIRDPSTLDGCKDLGV